jgi:aminoglycoside phosphotransferase (APT) family kinase protein
LSDDLDTLMTACRQAGLDASTAELIRASENTLFRLPAGIVGRVTRPGQLAAAAKEVRVARWLRASGVPVVEPIPGVDQPQVVNDRAVTFWRELPEHTAGTLTALATLLRHLHALPTPDLDLPRLQPFVRQRERIESGAALGDGDRAWLLDHLTALEARYADLPRGLPRCAVHGDAWAGNIAATPTGAVLLDLERFAVGPPEWDLTSTAVRYTTDGTCTAEEWAAYCDAYGHDVTTWAGYPILRDARELRRTTFAIQMAPTRSDIAEQARYRLGCIQGRNGPRPWGWTAVP